MPAATSCDGLISTNWPDSTAYAVRAQPAAMNPPATCWKKVGRRRRLRNRLKYIRANVETIDSSPAMGVPPSWMTTPHPSIAHPSTATRNEWGCGAVTMLSTSAAACSTVRRRRTIWSISRDTRVTRVMSIVR